MKNVSISVNTYLWLANHPDLVPYIQIESIPPCNKFGLYETKKTEAKKRKQNYVAQLSKFLKKDLQEEFPKDSDNVEVPGFDCAKCAIFIYHELQFLSKELFNSKNNNYSKSLQYVNDIIAMLKDSLENNDNTSNGEIDIILDIPALEKHLLQPSNYSIALETFFHFLTTNYLRSLSGKGSFQQIRKRMRQVLDASIAQMDMQLRYIYPSNHERIFQQILLSPSFPLSHEFIQIIASLNEIKRTSFMPIFNNFFVKLSRFFNLENSDDITVCVIIFLRVVFSIVYGSNPEYLFSKPRKRLSQFASVLTCRDICADTAMLSKEEMDANIIDVFYGKDFKRAQTHLTFAFFHTNPIDILFEIHESVSFVQRTVAQRLGIDSMRAVLPFEDLFGPLLGVCLTHDTGNIESLAEFLIDFSPQGLSPELEYTLANVRAILTFSDDYLVQKYADVDPPTGSL